MKNIFIIMALFAVTSAALAAPITNVGKFDYSGRLGSTWEWDKSVDGDISTFWYSKVGITTMPFITYEFDQVYQIGDVSITTPQYYGRLLTVAGVSVSTDGVNFTTVGDFTIDKTYLSTTTFNLGEISAKYVRIDGLEAYYGNWPDDKYITWAEALAGEIPDNKYGVIIGEITFDAVPEPATLGLLITGALALIRKKR